MSNINKIEQPRLQVVLVALCPVIVVQGHKFLSWTFKILTIFSNGGIIHLLLQMEKFENALIFISGSKLTSMQS